ncbi:MAG: outer membrane protein assembly factor BamD [Bacteroidota bacterium]
MNKFSLFTFAILVVLTTSCSEYNKVLKGDDYDAKWTMAGELFEKGLTPKIDKEGIPLKKRNGELKSNANLLLRSVGLYEQIYQRMAKTGEGEVAYYRIGSAYYHAKDYPMAGYYLGAFTQRYPYSAKTEEAMFLSALCSVKSSPEYSLDQNDTELAISNLQQFVDRYPDSPLIDSCNHIMDRMRLKLEKKDYESVKLYAKTENYRAAVTAAEAFNENYPLSSYKEEVALIHVNNCYSLAINSIDTKKIERFEKTIESCNTFVTQFPQSKDLNHVKRMKEEAEKNLTRTDKI